MPPSLRQPWTKAELEASFGALKRPGGQMHHYSDQCNPTKIVSGSPFGRLINSGKTKGVDSGLGSNADILVWPREVSLISLTRGLPTCPTGGTVTGAATTLPPV